MMWTFTRSLLSGLRRPVFIYLISLSFSMMLFFSFAMYFVEKIYNPGMATYFDTLYYTVTVMTGVGLGDLAPVTVMGKVLSMVMMLSGTGIFVCFTAVLAASILEIELNQYSKD